MPNSQVSLIFRLESFPNMFFTSDSSYYVSTRNIYTSLFCWLFGLQNTTLEQARRDATLIGDTLAKKKVKSNLTKLRYVLLGSKEFKERTRMEAKEAPVMWETILWKKVRKKIPRQHGPHRRTRSKHPQYYYQVLRSINR